MLLAKGYALTRHEIVVDVLLRHFVAGSQGGSRLAEQLLHFVESIPPHCLILRLQFGYSLRIEV